MLHSVKINKRERICFQIKPKLNRTDKYLTRSKDKSYKGISYIQNNLYIYNIILYYIYIIYIYIYIVLMFEVGHYLNRTSDILSTVTFFVI